MKKYLQVLAVGFIAFGIAIQSSCSKGFSPSTYPQKGDSPTISLVAVGDIMLSRHVAREIKRRQGVNYPFVKTQNLIESADIALGNLEGPITPGREIFLKELILRADPEVVSGLKWAGFDVLSLANNHIFDFGEKGLNDTLKYLDETNISHVGAGKNATEARTPVVKEAKGIKVAFLSYNDSDVQGIHEAAEREAGTALMRIESLKKDVSRAKAEADLVVVSMHAGEEYAGAPNGRQRNFARKAIDAGATVVIGHHPHVVQEVERYKHGLIFYSLGNFVFDQLGSLETREGVVARIILGKRGVLETEVILTRIGVGSQDYAQPQILSTKEGRLILNRLKIGLKDEPVFFWNGRRFGERSWKALIVEKRGKPERVKQRVDLDNDGLMEEIVLDHKRTSIFSGRKMIWQSDSSWRVDNVLVADINNDGRKELLLSLWKRGSYGRDLPFWVKKNDLRMGNHLFLFHLENQEFRMRWGSYRLDNPIVEMTVANSMGDGTSKLVVLEGDYNLQNGSKAQYLTVWSWNSWVFFNEFRSRKGNFSNLEIRNVRGRQEIYLKEN